ncbi:Saf4/Yju2 family protein [Aspergillus stella-maris]|uniref:Saf4/Yju2 family protein n=1 Tax=Aspergillus stella-maris TaxID=1810926 RepID=UPI003CCCE4A9
MQGFNMGRYIPPDQEGHTTANKLANKHPLGSRARHLHTKGALIVRFEMPFATWCTNCQPEEIIGQGVRFNAEKKKVGHYYSTPVYSFRIKHTVCGGWIEIRTDPKNTAYVVVEGGRKRDLGTDEDGRGFGVGKILVGGKSGSDDPFAKIESKTEDKRAVDEAKSRILELQSRQNRDWDDPYAMSRRLRKGFRAERKVLERKEGVKEALKDRMSLGIEIVDEVEEDKVRAGMVDFDAHGPAKSRVRARGMFEDSNTFASAIGTGDSWRKDMKKSGKRKPADLVAERKAMFRSELAGNTRATIDPFLNDTNDSWKPEVRKRRKDLVKLETKKSNEPVRCDDHSVNGKPSPNEPPAQERLNVAIAREKDVGPSSSLALVDYRSESE